MHAGKKPRPEPSIDPLCSPLAAGLTHALGGSWGGARGLATGRAAGPVGSIRVVRAASASRRPGSAAVARAAHRDPPAARPSSIDPARQQPVSTHCPPLLSVRRARGLPAQPARKADSGGDSESQDRQPLSFPGANETLRSF